MEERFHKLSPGWNSVPVPLANLRSPARRRSSSILQSPNPAITRSVPVPKNQSLNKSSITMASAPRLAMGPPPRHIKPRPSATLVDDQLDKQFDQLLHTSPVPRAIARTYQRYRSNLLDPVSDPDRLNEHRHPSSTAAVTRKSVLYRPTAVLVVPESRKHLANITVTSTAMDTAPTDTYMADKPPTIVQPVFQPVNRTVSQPVVKPINRTWVNQAVYQPPEKHDQLVHSLAHGSTKTRGQNEAQTDATNPPSVVNLTSQISPKLSSPELPAKDDKIDVNIVSVPQLNMEEHSNTEEPLKNNHSVKNTTGRRTTFKRKAEPVEKSSSPVRKKLRLKPLTGAIPTASLNKPSQIKPIPTTNPPRQRRTFQKEEGEAANKPASKTPTTITSQKQQGKANSRLLPQTTIAISGQTKPKEPTTQPIAVPNPPNTELKVQRQSIASVPRNPTSRERGSAGTNALRHLLKIPPNILATTGSTWDSSSGRRVSNRRRSTIAFSVSIPETTRMPVPTATPASVPSKATATTHRCPQSEVKTSTQVRPTAKVKVVRKAAATAGATETASNRKKKTAKDSELPNKLQAVAPKGSASAALKTDMDTLISTPSFEKTAISASTQSTGSVKKTNGKEQVKLREQKIKEQSKLKGRISTMKATKIRVNEKAWYDFSDEE